MRKAITALASIALALSITGVAQAHDADVYYDSAPSIPGLETWPQTQANGLHQIEYHFESGFGAMARNRVRDAMEEWESVSGVQIDFVEGDVVSNVNPTSCDDNPSGVTVIGWQNTMSTEDGRSAETRRCWNGAGNIYQFQMAFRTVPFGFDSASDWYLGTDTGEAADLWGLATHELGHALGFEGHFPSSGTACQPGTYATLCIPVNASARSLETHDKHTLQDAY